MIPEDKPNEELADQVRGALGEGEPERIGRNTNACPPADVIFLTAP
jgi:hypothetical protein